MARTNLYQMYDLNAGLVAGPIIIERNHAPAIRAFTSVLTNANTTPGQHPADFQLRHIGSQDDESGEITPITPTTVASGAQWVEQQRAAQVGDLHA